MKKTFFCSVVCALLPLALLWTEGKAHGSSGDEPASLAQPREFQGDDLPTVLRILAREARTTLVLDDKVIGKVTMRVEDMSPLQAIKVICASKGLIVENKDGILFVRPDPSKPVQIPPPSAGSPRQDEVSADAFAQMLTPAFVGSMTRICDLTLDYLARPETARKLAKAKRELYEALIADGFTKDEAFHIILTNQEFNLPGSNK